MTSSLYGAGAEYALHSLLVLAARSEPVSVRDLASFQALPERFLAKISPTCSDTVSRSCAPRLPAVSGIADFGSGAGCGCGEALAIARSVSMTCARFLSSERVSSARFA